MIENILNTLVHISANHYFGVSVLVDVLQGSENEKIIRNKLNMVKEFKSMSYLTREENTKIVYWLIEKKYILRTKGNYPVLHITNTGLNYREYLTPQNTKALITYLNEKDNFDYFKEEDI